jgi:large subunit ribosomal protein L5
MQRDHVGLSGDRGNKMAKARLEDLYRNKIKLDLQKNLGLDNIMSVPKIEKMVLNVGVKEAVSDSRVLQKVVERLTQIAGQTPVITKARKSIAGFKIREGMPLGVKVTLRGKVMYEFLDRLINIALPNVRDFRGVTDKFDKQGNYNLGIKEWSVFPEADTNTGEKVYGFNITVHTSTKNSEHAFALLKSFNMPFRKQEK